MSAATSIQWTHHTFNPWSGCAKVHAGCRNCYAEALPPSMRRQAPWGEVWQGGGRVVASDGYWANPLAWARAAARAGARHRVFCASTADVLEVPNHPPGKQDARVDFVRLRLEEERARLWNLIRETATVCQGCQRPQATAVDLPGRTAHLERLAAASGLCTATDARCTRSGSGGLDWLLLTKRPENWRLVPEDVRPLVWLGTSVSDQETADEWVPRLLEAKGFGVRFLSVEPLLEHVDLSQWLPEEPCCCGAQECANRSPIDWVIIGGESGRRARQCRVEDLLSLVRQCRAAGVAPFVKQVGAHYVDAEYAVGGVLARPPPEYGALQRRLVDSKGGDMSEWPEDLRVRELPEVRHA